MAKTVNSKAESEYVLYRISGYSLEGDHIYNGDFVVVNEKEPVKNDDIVAVRLIDNSFRVKHFFKKNGHLYFYPFQRNSRSKKNPVIIDTAKIEGKVIAVICCHKRKHKNKGDNSMS